MFALGLKISNDGPKNTHQLSHQCSPTIPEDNAMPSICVVLNCISCSPCWPLHGVGHMIFKLQMFFLRQIT